jgi:hypothetical protein
MPRPVSAMPSAAIFIPIGYIPARKNPVINRNMNNAGSPSLMKEIPRLAAAPSIELIKNTSLGEKRSDIRKKAKNKVPAIKPNCTEDVT